MNERDERFAAYFATRSGVLRGTAFLLCGDWHRAEDLVQNAFVKLYLAWHRVGDEEKLDAYTRQILVRTFLDEKRRGWWRVRLFAAIPERAGPPPPGVEERVLRRHPVFVGRLPQCSRREFLE